MKAFAWILLVVLVAALVVYIAIKGKKNPKKISTKMLCECALLIALEIVLNRFASFQVLGLKFGLSFIPMALAGMLFGPAWAAVCYGISDVIGALVFPMGAYFPGFTISVVLMGIVYGIFFYKKDKIRMFPETIVPAVINTCILGLLLNTLWMTVLYTSKGFSGWLLYRLPQEAGLLILHIVLTPLIGKLAEALRKAGLAE